MYEDELELYERQGCHTFLSPGEERLGEGLTEQSSSLSLQHRRPLQYKNKPRA